MSDRNSGSALSYRRAHEGDIDMITQFNLQLAAETEGKSLDPDTIRTGVSRGMQQFPEAQYFVAERERRVVGQLMFTREWSDWRNGWMLWLQSVYVQPDWRSHGVFRCLLNESLAAVRTDMDAIGLRLYVDHANEGAIEVYARLGFEDAGYRMMEIVPLNRASHSEA